MKSVAYIVGFIVGILFVVFVYLISKKIEEKKYGKVEKPYYDERQIAVRGKAYALGFFLFSGFELIMLFLLAMEVTLPFSNLMIHGFILFTSFLGFIIYSIWTDAYFQNGEKKGPWLIIIIIATLVNLFSFILSLFSSENIAYGNLLISIFFVIILVNVWAKNLVDKKTAKNE